jgi:hypothetical protein
MVWALTDLIACRWQAVAGAFTPSGCFLERSLHDKCHFKKMTYRGCEKKYFYIK